jgi:3-oxoacyl-[acyl-carrier protein] reductase
MGLLSKKVAIVTGGANGIGAAYVHRLASLGATVIIADLDVATATTTAKAIVDELPGARVEARRVDVTDLDTIEALRDMVRVEYGGLDILVNNAAFYRGKSPMTVEDLDVAEWQRMFQVNVEGVFLMCKVLMPLLKEKKGLIVNQSSSGAFMAAPRSVHYSTSKAAIVAFTRSLAAEVGPDGVRVNAIAPGYTRTEATKETLPGREEAAAQATALRRVGDTSDLTGTLEFLCTDASAWMTGQSLIVDGGTVYAR